ncbi:MAG: Na/Pi cotransporter family protein [Catonella sp.]|jgi:phosphate:Na+ symporter|nr:Na/Pi cotransporter family protein [Catonella sp.]MDY6357017.1 Na/Pi cotransporter family protein [Catonella sp.]
MNSTLQTIFGLLGGLGIFLFGMNMMSDSLQKAAGEGMKKILGMLTKNPVLGVLSGALVTAVLQSSSATSVMAIGFVSAGLMTLPQAISVIFGANIGTTMTAQLIAFQISDYIYVIIAAGFIVMFFSKKEKAKYIGETIFAFGLLFLGIETMGSTMKPLANSHVFVNMISNVSHIPVLGFFTGLIMTLVVQSSSATIAVLQNFAATPGPDGVSSIIGLAGAIPVLLGDNVGTTITAVLASITQSKNAKRTAAAHCIFNLSGAILFIFLLKPYTAFIQYISPKGNEIDVISRQIANAHTGLNVTMALIWTPLIGLMVKLVMTLIPDSVNEKTVGGNVIYLDEKVKKQSALALHLVSKEVIHCSDIVKNVMDKMVSVPVSKVSEIVTDIDELNKNEHDISKQITDYVQEAFSAGSFTEEMSSDATGALFILGDLDRLSANCSLICHNLSENVKGKHHYSKDAIEQITKSALHIKELYFESINSIITGDKIDEERYNEERNKLMDMNVSMRRGHMKRVAKGKCDNRLTGSYNELLHLLERAGDACADLAETASKDVYFNALLDDSKARLETVQAENETEALIPSEPSEKEVNEDTEKPVSKPKKSGKKKQKEKESSKKTEDTAKDSGDI